MHLRRPAHDEENALAALVALGDGDARNRLVEANLGLVRKIAQEFRGRGLLIEDLVGEGNLGLIKAAQEFDPQFGARFSTYAAYWIKEAIRRAIRDTTATIRVPAHVFRLVAKVRRNERLFCRKWGRVPTTDEVASLLRLSRGQKFLLAHGFDAGRTRLECTLGRATGFALSDVAPIAVLRSKRHWITKNTCAALRQIERLKPREQAVVKAHLGLDCETLSFADIGRKLGVTRECARRIYLRALRKLCAGKCSKTP